MIKALLKNNRIAVLASGTGSNLEALLQAIQDGTCAAEVALVISNKEHAPALDIARKAGVPQVMFINPKAYLSREGYDDACAKIIRQENCQLIVLAGYMRILSSPFVQQFPNRIINIHPSLLPSFIGAKAVQDALDYGVQITGCTVHIVTDELDSGAILAQTAVSITKDDDFASLHRRIQQEEHRLYPQVIQMLLTSSKETNHQK